MSAKLQLIFITILMLSVIKIVYSNENASILQKFIDETNTLQAIFKQTVFNDQQVKIENSEGIISLKKPNQFRWEYQQPYHQIIIADGQKLWFIDEDIEQVTVKNQNAHLDQTPASFLSGTTQWKKDFILQKHELLPEQQQRFILIPKDNDSHFAQIELIFKYEILSKMVLIDKAQQLTEIQFERLQINIEIPSQLFQFTPTKGLDIITH